MTKKVVNVSKIIEGDRIVTTYDRDRPGKVVRLGVEVSEVKFDDGHSRFIPNEFLVKLKEIAPWR